MIVERFIGGLRYWSLPVNFVGVVSLFLLGKAASSSRQLGGQGAERFEVCVHLESPLDALTD